MIMKVAVFTVENSSDVQLAVEMIKAMDAQVVCSPKEALTDPVVTHYQKQQESPVEVVETPSIADKQAEEEDLFVKQAEEEKKAAAKAEREAKAAAVKAEREAKAAAKAKLEEEAKAVEAAKAAKEEEEAKAAEAKAAKEEEAKAAEAKAAKAAEYEKRTQRVEDSGVSYEMIRIKATKRVKEGVLTREGLIELLAKYKAKSLSQVKESDYGQLYNDLD
nr:MAG TPA: hypothetical protein [Caudoviricetes sp.]